jgi:hypothetical protein
MPNLDSNYIDLADLNLTIKPSYDWRDGSMHRQEERITRELIEQGLYQPMGNWFDGERDSFGPLSRCLRVKTPGDLEKIVVYG